MLLAKLSPANSGRQRKIYASRSTQSVRKLTNEALILPLLTAHGFEVVHFERLSFLEQVSLMSETSVFAGVHGANMTNLMFLPAEAVVVEFLNADHGDLCYFRLASCLSLPYYCIPCASTQPELFNQSDLTVATDFITRTLTQLANQ
jgi:capsular polysaccharide biosynthesis protein